MIVKCDDELFYNIVFMLKQEGFEPDQKSIRIKYENNTFKNKHFWVKFLNTKDGNWKKVQVDLDSNKVEANRTRTIPIQQELADCITLRRRIEDRLRKMSEEEQYRVLPTLADALGVKLY